MLKLDKSKMLLLYYRKYVEEERNLVQREIQYEEVDIENELKLCDEIEKAYKYKEHKLYCNEYEKTHKQNIEELYKYKDCKCYCDRYEQKHRSRLTEGIWWDFKPNEEDPMDFSKIYWENNNNDDDDEKFWNSVIEGTCPQDYMDDDDCNDRVEISEPVYVYDSDYAEL